MNGRIRLMCAAPHSRPSATRARVTVGTAAGTRRGSSARISESTASPSAGVIGDGSPLAASVAAPSVVAPDVPESPSTVATVASVPVTAAHTMPRVDFGSGPPVSVRDRSKPPTAAARCARWPAPPCRSEGAVAQTHALCVVLISPRRTASAVSTARAAPARAARSSTSVVSSANSAPPASKSTSPSAARDSRAASRWERRSTRLRLDVML